MNHEQAIAKSLAVLGATFNREIDNILLEAYSVALRELTPQQIENGTAIALRSCDFMPKPAEIIEFARMGGVSYEAQAVLAFDELNAALTADDSRS